MKPPRVPELTLIHTAATAASPLVEVAPGQYAVPTVHPADVPRYGVVRLMRQSDGTYAPVLKHHGQWRRCGAELLKEAGLDAIPIRTLYRLVNAGFVRQSRPSPKCILIDLGSLVDHLEATREPEFWTADRIAQFQQAHDWIGGHR